METYCFLFFDSGMAGKLSDEQFFELEKKMKRYETIIGQMTEEERSNPDLLCKQGGNDICSYLKIRLSMIPRIASIYFFQEKKNLCKTRQWEK